MLGRLLNGEEYQVGENGEGKGKFWEAIYTRLYNVQCTLGCPKMHLFPWNIPWPGAIESLNDVGFENIFGFFFKFCSTPGRAIVKKTFSDFRKFYYTTFLMNLHYFPYFYPTKTWTFFLFIFFYNFQRHSLLTALHNKNLCIFGPPSCKYPNPDWVSQGGQGKFFCKASKIIGTEHARIFIFWSLLADNFYWHVIFDNYFFNV